MPGNEWEKFANLRAYYGFMWSHPGKKLIFMGCEFAQATEWNGTTPSSTGTRRAETVSMPGVQAPRARSEHALSRPRRPCTAKDCEADGFQWIDVERFRRIPIYAFIRRGGDRAIKPAVVVCNFTPVERGGLAAAASPPEGTLARGDQYRCRASMAAANRGNHGRRRRGPDDGHARASRSSARCHPAAALSTLIFVHQG